MVVRPHLSLVIPQPMQQHGMQGGAQRRRLALMLSAAMIFHLALKASAAAGVIGVL